RLSPRLFFLLGMIAVCGNGRPSGWRNKATTANQSANAPTVAASLKARNQGQNPAMGAASPCRIMAWLSRNRQIVSASKANALRFMRRRRRSGESGREDDVDISTVYA